LRILADENVHAEIVAWLRAAGHDVLWAAERLGGSPDADLASLAFEEGRIMLTNDLDFGRLVFRERKATRGVILMRFRTASSSELAPLFASHWPRVEKEASGHFVVLTNRKHRISHL